MELSVDVSAIEQHNFDTASVDLKYSEFPARTHKVVQSMINWDEQQQYYGTCADEYYIMTGNMMKNFSFKTCVEPSYIRV
ncbi:hypothetical protein MKY34_15695 [Sporosarcina sp. FSL K6-1522]|uniref:hypothetical protein n=1 Tax=Sporosarcina sp. FSL K6-1522 TaxID=2921554 RepID=UPI00315B199B